MLVKDKVVLHRQVAAENDGNVKVLEASTEARRPGGSRSPVSGVLLPRVVTFISDGAAQQVISL